MNPKKIVTLFTLTLCIFNLQAQVSDTTENMTRKYAYLKNQHKFPDATNAFKLNMLSPFYSNLSLFYQYAFSAENSFQLGASFMDFSGIGETSSNPPFNTREAEKTTMVTITPEYRYNLNGQNLSGAYIGAFMRYMSMNYSFDGDTTSNYTTPPTPVTNLKHYSYEYTSLGIGFLIGNQVIYKRRVIVDFYVGPVYNVLLSSSNPIKTNDDIVKSDDIPALFIKGYGIRAGFTVGFAF